jgi:hypothetical protein
LHVFPLEREREREREGTSRGWKRSKSWWTTTFETREQDHMEHTVTKG